ncbi:DUF2567 domain-containing protein [Prauserella muralis]|uniref:Uncharacterized protein n=1 Tax=Prauserella muralis TaxID=588067 RepID=A0A2V4AZC2_9PSEU|nr:DUF2567 domain-containing protein [Prauserella muralis]PXY27274.1 hypothetical protein BAY60_12520 [Prauserella muralis]TWE23059.1 uncharacterized protein DUF2567 [Prauserella muralis]
MPEHADTAWFAQAFAGVRRERPRVVVKADLLPAVSVLSMIALLGIPLGWIWSRLAPPQRMRVIDAERDPVPLQLESWHRFDGLAIYLLLGLVTGVLVGVAVWFLRERRGPVVLFAAVAGSLLAAWLGMRMGIAFAEGLYTVTEAPAIGDVVEAAPVLESGWAVVAQPFTTAVAYGLLATWNSRDDLGRRLA